jgi:hypothetical protein
VMEFLRCLLVLKQALKVPELKPEQVELWR